MKKGLDIGLGIPPQIARNYRTIVPITKKRPWTVLETPFTQGLTTAKEWLR